MLICTLALTADEGIVNPLEVAEAETQRGKAPPQDLTTAFGATGARWPACRVQQSLPGWEPASMSRGTGGRWAWISQHRVLKGTLGVQMWPPRTSALQRSQPTDASSDTEHVS